jgi:hypothetical protein
MLPDDFVHQRHCHIGESIPAGLFAYINLWPILHVGENQHNGFGLPVDIIGLLAVDILMPGGFFLGQDGL